MDWQVKRKHSNGEAKNEYLPAIAKVNWGRSCRGETIVTSKIAKHKYKWVRWEPKANVWIRNYNNTPLTKSCHECMWLHVLIIVPAQLYIPAMCMYEIDLPYILNAFVKRNRKVVIKIKCTYIKQTQHVPQAKHSFITSTQMTFFYNLYS